jgi:predicted O-methyltransferase YrrM
LRASERSAELPLTTKLFRELPRFHRGGTHTFHLARETVAFIEREIPDGSTTLETGSGLSTVLFALKNCRHTCITPQRNEADRVEQYLRSLAEPTANVAFVIAKSQDVLPSLDLPPLDCVLIDGQHAFPIPVLDWYYAQRRLSVGGVLIIDDTQMWTGTVLRDFLREEPAWELLENFFGRAAAFRKTCDATDAVTHNQQPYIRRRSRRGFGTEKVSRRWEVLMGRMRNEHNAKASMSDAARSYRGPDDPSSLLETPPG